MGGFNGNKQSREIVDSSGDISHKTDNLNRAMKPWQIMMVGVGGTIGTGLFLSSGFVMQNAGPGGTLLAYLFGGIIMYFLMLVLGELTVAMPVAGGVQAYATDLISPSLGFTVGWMRWLACSVMVPTQLVASSIIIKNIFPNINTTIFIIACTILLFIMNLGASHTAGSSNFIFNSFKFFLIIGFILIGSVMIFRGVNGAPATGFGNYVNEGGFFPTSFSALLSTLMAAAFAYSGADISATAAGESENPGKDMPKAINWTIWGLLGAYMLSFVILLAVRPWSSYSLDASPFAQVFDMIEIPAAGTVVNVFILTSALSSANAFVFASTRLLWSLAEYKQAPSLLGQLNAKKVPVAALIATIVFSGMAVASAFLAAGTVYLFFQSIIGIANVFNNCIYALCLFAFRKQMTAKGLGADSLQYTSPLYPLSPALLIILSITLFLGMVFDPSQRMAVYTGIPTLLVLFFGYKLFARKQTTASIDK